MAGPGAEFIGSEEAREVMDVLESGYLFRYGDPRNPKFKAKVWKFEQELAAYSGARHALAVNSGTSALLTGLAALGVGPGDEVIVPGYTFIASISSIIYARAIPVLCEVDESLTMDPADVEARITPRTRAILPVHMLGNPCRMDRLMELARKHKLLVLEDAAQAAGASFQGRKVGAIGDMGIFSFNVFKTITAGDGGAVITSDDNYYARAFGFHDQGHLPNRQGVEVGQRPFIGLDFRMTELSGAVLLAQLRKIDRIIGSLRIKKARFKAAISGCGDFSFRRINDPEGECATLLTVIFPTREKARAVAERLKTTTVDHSGWHVYNNMEQILNQLTVTQERCPFTCAYYKGQAEYRKGMLPRTDDILSRSMNISIGVSDAGLGAGFGITAVSGEDEIDRKAAEFVRVVREVG
ncbi:MAG: UDP-4-amino-4-deoxy-L-arabinose--oxoglutarate aminotransferase [candidate division TA06 bacterium ADurb.Bin417]|uniref:UDP-4-amino-4-deoxy-L-arabinose--oxoglutarate aminotransferase n=1 Tax=candidate division TA06 bacterium ADurb.Bin417 TaxID=1852828 RepID=A0A1V5MLK2_UNCT6|nr:MAG: UDP-4-amino-4-deoxy-L-arabinose--oxoglutarate aminotransferase [candidate division TA06 bacterium ADurb.Bin417]